MEGSCCGGESFRTERIWLVLGRGLWERVDWNGRPHRGREKATSGQISNESKEVEGTGPLVATSLTCFPVVGEVFTHGDGIAKRWPYYWQRVRWAPTGSRFWVPI